MAGAVVPQPEDWDKYKVQPTTQKDDWSQYAVPKKALGNGGASTSLPSSNGSNNFQSFLQSTDNNLTPVTDPALKQQIQDKQTQAQQTISDHLKKVTDTYDSHLSPDEKQAFSNLDNNYVNKDALRANTPEEVAQEKAMDTPLGKLAKQATYVGSEFSKGGLQIVKGGAWMLNHLNTGFSDTQTIPDETFKSADKATDFGLTAGQKNQIENDRTMGMGATRTLGMLANFIPTAVGGEVTGAPKAMFALQGFGQGKETMDKIDPDKKLNPIVRDTYILGNGIANAALMGDAAETTFAKLPAQLRGDITSHIAMEALKQNGEKALTSDGYKALVEKGTKDWADNFYKLGTDYVAKTARVGLDLSGLNTAQYALQKGVDLASDKPVFNANLGGLAENISNTMLNQAPVLGAIGSAADVSKLTPYSDFKNNVVDALTQDPTKANEVKQNITEHGQQMGWTPGQIDATNNHIDQIAKAATKLPNTIKPEKRADAIQLVLGRDELKQQLADETGKRSAMDESVADIPTQHEQYLTDKIDQANDKLRDLATGKKTTYSKGTAEDEGMFFKTTDGNKQEITESRYNLENLERNEKVSNNAQENVNGQKTDAEKGNNEENGNQEVLSKPTEEQIFDDLKNNRFATFKYDKKDDIPNVFKYREPTVNELTDKDGKVTKQFIITVPQSEADYLLQQKGETDNATQNGNIEQSSVSEYQGTTEQQQGVEENRNNQEKPIEETKAETGSSNSAEQSGKVTSIKNAKIDEDRQKRGLSPLMSETKKDFLKVWDNAMKRLDENPNEGTDLVDELHKNPRATTDEENALIAHTLVEAKNDYDKANEAIIKAQDAGEDVAPHEAKLDAVSDRLQKIEEVAKKTGTETGRGLNSRKMMVNDDMSLASLETQKRVALGRKLTTDERAELRKVHEDYKAKSDAYEAKIAELEERNRNLIERDALNRLKAEAKKEARTQTRASRASNKQDIIANIQAKLKAERQKGTAQSSIPFAQQLVELYKIAPDLAKLAKLYIADGVDKLDELIDKIHESLPDYDKRAVRDALSGYGKEPEKETKGELQKKLEDLKTQAKLQSKLEDLEAKQFKASEKNKPIISKEISDLRKQVRDLQQPETSLKAIKTRTANQIAEYQRRLKEGDFSPAEKKSPTLLDPEAIAAKGELNRVKRDFDAELEKDRLANRGTGEKILDKALKYRRAELLLNLSGAAKVGMAAAYRILGAPLHEISGTVMKRVVPGLSKVAKLAPREGHDINFKTEWTATKTIWATETLAEVKKKFKGKLDNLDTAFGDKAERPSTGKIDRLLDLVGSIHSAEKEFLRQNEFRRSVILRTKYAQEQGIDTDNPLVQIKIGKEALDDADRAIFMGKNLANTGFKMLVNYLETAKTLGKSGQISANILKFMFPIVRVTTNYALEKAQYTPVIGATKAIMIMSRGLNNMKPEEADYVMRIMKKQGISAGLTAIGYFNPQVFGGFHIPGQKRDDKDPLSANDVNILGVKIPHFLTHTPLLSALQLGATIRRAVDSQDKSVDKKYKTGVGDVLLGTASDVVESTPFYETPKEAIKAMESANSFDQFAGGFLRSLIVPSVVNQVAEYTDKDAEGNSIKRSPKNMGQGIEQGIPGLRENVPIKNPYPRFNEIHLPDKSYKLNNDQVEERQKYYDTFMKSDGAKQLQLTIAKTTNIEEKKKLSDKLKKMASKVSKMKILQHYHNAQTGGYNLEIDE